MQQTLLVSDVGCEQDETQHRLMVTESEETARSRGSSQLSRAANCKAAASRREQRFMGQQPAASTNRGGGDQRTPIRRKQIFAVSLAQ